MVTVADDVSVGGCYCYYCLNPMFVLVGSINRSGLLQLSFDKLFCFWVVVWVLGGERGKLALLQAAARAVFVVVFLRCVLCVSYKSPKQGLNLSRS